MGIKVGDRAAELRSFQILSLAIDETALRLSHSPSEKPAWILTGPTRNRNGASFADGNDWRDRNTARSSCFVHKEYF